MRRLSSFAILFALSISAAPQVASAQSGGASGQAHAKVQASLSIKADVSAAGKAKAAVGDAAYAKGEFEAALVAYGEGFAQTRDAAFIYAMAKCRKALGMTEEAKASFKMYVAASGNTTLKYKADAEAEIGAKAEGAVGAVGGTLGKVKDTTTKAVTTVGAGVYTAAKVSISASVKASAKAEAKAADEAYAARKYDDAARSYLAAYAKSQQAIALYAAGQAHAQAGHAIEARALLTGYLASKPKGQTASDARSLLLALGGSTNAVAKVSVKAKVSAKAKVDAGKGDKAIKAGQYQSAIKAYADAYAKAQDTALLYAQGMAQYYAGLTSDAVVTLKAYLAATGNLEFKASAQATLRASGSAG